MPGVQQAAQEFLRHRTQWVSLRPRFTRAVASRGAAKDNFDAAFGSSGHYVGKDYGAGSTEIISMGLEKLYNDPAGFARQDPEYCAFIIGALNGSLRNKKIPRA